MPSHIMENQDIKRGIDFENRFGESKSYIEHAFSWWNGGKLNRKTFLFLCTVLLINTILVYPIFGKDTSAAYSSSVALSLISDVLSFTLHVTKSSFFSGITTFSLCIAPISFYLFVRKIVMRHELTALFATLLFILPNPIFNNVPIMIHALLKGDGAHIFMFSLIPLFLLYVQSFLANGMPILGALAAIGTAGIAIISPFALFNLLLFYIILTIAEGFLGNFRVKVMRLIFLLLTAFALSLFWYYPTVIMQILILSYVKVAMSKFLSILPIAIPLLPIVGAISFLIFDRRERLKPIFISMFFFLMYLFLFSISSDLQISGIFTAERYTIELSFASSFFLAVLIVLLVELGIRSILENINNKLLLGFLFLGEFLLGTVLCFITYQAITIVHTYINIQSIATPYTIGIGGIKRIFDFRDISSIIVSCISFLTFMILFFVTIKYPLKVNKSKQFLENDTANQV